MTNMKVDTCVRESKTTTKGVSFSNGGFIELEVGDSKGYLKVHVTEQDGVTFSASQAWRWIQHGTNKKNIKLLRELRDAADALLESVDDKS